MKSSLKYLVSMGLVSMLFSANLLAQNRLAYTEFGIGAGTLNYSGDIATTTSVSSLLTETRPNFNVFAKRHFNDWFSLGIMASYGWFYANDENHSHQNRGLEVTTSMFQINPFLEMNIIKFGKFHYDRKFTVFIRAGGGYLAYNPDPVAAEIYPPGYEPEIYAYTSFNFFGALGVKFRLGYETILTIDVGIHNSGADNLDGILAIDPNERGANDTYGGLNVSVSHAIF